MGRAAGAGCGGHHTSGHYGVTGHRGRGRCRHFYGRTAFFDMQGVDHLPTFLRFCQELEKNSLNLSLLQVRFSSQTLD